MDEPVTTGRCLCGRTRYHFREKPDHAAVCHCRSCQRDSGAPMVAWVTIPKKDFSFEGQAPMAYASSPGRRRCHCRTCGTALTYETDAAPESIDVTLASLDDPEAIVPDRHIWVSQKAGWVHLDDGLPQYAGWSSDD